MKLHWKIIIGMVLGVLFGLIMSQTSFGSNFIGRLDFLSLNFTKSVLLEVTLILLYSPDS